MDEGKDSGADYGYEEPGSGLAGKPGQQYQCPGTQYHDYWCDDGFGEADDEPDVDEPDVNEPDTGTDTPREEPTPSCPETAVAVPVDVVPAEGDIDNGTWDKPHRSYCEDSTPDTPISPGASSQPPTGKQRPTAQVPQPPVPPASAQVPPAQPPTEQPATPSGTEQASAPPPPDAPPAQPSSASPPPPQPAPRPSVPAADAVPKDTRSARVGAPQESETPTRAIHQAVAVVQPTSRVVARPAPKTTVRVPKAPAATKPHSVKKPQPQLRKARTTAPAKRPATERTAQRPPRATRTVAASSQSLDGWLLLALALFGLSLLAFAYAAVSEVDGGTAALTKMRSRLGSKGLSASRAGLDARNDGAASSRTPDGIRYRD